MDIHDPGPGPPPPSMGTASILLHNCPPHPVHIHVLHVFYLLHLPSTLDIDVLHVLFLPVPSNT